MRSGNTVLVIRSVIAVLVAGLAIVNFASGRVVVGVLFAALAIMNVALLVTIRRRRRELRQRLGRERQSAGA